METGLESNAAIGRAKTVLVFSNGAEKRAFITTLVAQWSPRRRSLRLRFRGPVKFTKETQAHIEEVVLPAVEGVCALLGLETGSFVVSGVNLGAASSRDIGLDISGFSADLALFLAMLSARLRIPLPQDVVCTGHIASVDGDVRLVRNLPLKLGTAERDGSIARFIHSPVDVDASLEGLAPAEFRKIADMFATRSGHPKTIAVRGVDELLKAVSPEEAVISAALASDYFDRQFPNPSTSGPVGRAARFLGADMERRFWAVVEPKLTAGDAKAAGCLLEEYICLWVRRQRYPENLGRTLHQLLQSVPPSIRLSKLTRPLLSVQSCIKLSQYATSHDVEDVLGLYRVATGGTGSPPAYQPSRRHPPKPGRKGSSSTLDIVLAEIGKEYLTEKISGPIDAARASFLLESVTAENPVQTLETITSFYIHLQRHTNRTARSLTFDEAGPEAQTLLERAFARKGGTAAALAEAQSGIEGGLRFVLDQMTEQFKRDCQEKHVLHVITTALNPLDWPAKVNFIKHLFHRCSGLLPTELISQPPERFARDCERIVRLYVNALDEMKQVLRAL
jgi:hypothetical protein